MAQSLLLIVSGPAGSGKTTLCDAMLKAFPEIQRVITSTTRPKREKEVDGRDYYFFSREAFEAKIADDAFYEYANVHGKSRYYGTLKSEIDGKLAQNIDLLLNIDVQGAASFREAAKVNPVFAEKLVTVFVKPKSFSQLRERLVARGDDNDAEIVRRLQSAEKELLEASAYDHVLESGTREEDFAALEHIFQQEKVRRKNA